MQIAIEITRWFMAIAIVLQAVAMLQKEENVGSALITLLLSVWFICCLFNF